MPFEGEQAIRAISGEDGEEQEELLAARALGSIREDRDVQRHARQGAHHRQEELLLGRAPRIHWYSLLDLPRDASVGFVTGATMATFTCLAAARREILRRFGHDLDEVARIFVASSACGGELFAPSVESREPGGETVGPTDSKIWATRS